MTLTDQDKMDDHLPNIVNGIEIPPLELYPQTHLCVEAQTLTHSPSEPWILAPIVVQFQKTTMKKAPAKTQESRRAFIVQTILPFFLAGLGLIFAGHILENGEKSPLFQQLPDLVTLVPTLLGLKGNLEMTLGSRLSTLAHLGEMDSMEKIWSVTISNLALVQCQAILISTIAVIPAVLLGEGENTFENVVTTLFASVSTASITSFLLGIVMILVVIVSRRFKLNPDNIVTPIAASLGDVATLQILLLVGGFMLGQVKLYGAGIPAVALVGFYVIAVLGGYLAQTNRYTFEVLKHGWYPILIAMVITLGSGFVLKEALHLFPPIAAFTPLVNGVGGNLVAVQTSRIGTRLHQARKNKEEVAHNLWMYASPWHAFFKTHEDSITARLLIMMSLPGNLLFLQVVFLVGCGFNNSFLFAVSFVFVSFIQISTLLYICQILVRALWKRRVDPDNAAIPLLTALGDLLGTGLLFFDFWFLYHVFNMTALANAAPTGTH